MISGNKSQRPGSSPRSTSSSTFRIKVLIEQDQLVPVLFCCISLFISMTWPVPMFVREKHWHQTMGQLKGNISKTHEISRASWAFNFETGSIKIIMTFEGIHQEIVHCNKSTRKDTSFDLLVLYIKHLTVKPYSWFGRPAVLSHNDISKHSSSPSVRVGVSLILEVQGQWH